MIELAISVVIALSASWAILYPLFSSSEEISSSLEERKDFLIDQIAQLDARFRAGEIEENYYRGERARLVREAAACLSKMEA